MCIFTKETIAEKTIVAAGEGFYAYQNKVTTRDRVVMILPVPGWNPHFWQSDGDLLDNLLAKWRIATNHPVPTMRSRGIEKSYQVGQYTIHEAEYGGLTTALIELSQPIHSWMGQFVSRYENWNFLLVEMQAGDSMANQPLLVTYDPFWPDVHFAPALDIHGPGQFEDSVVRNHMIFFEDKQTPDFSYDGPEPLRRDWTGFMVGYDQPLLTKNGDFVFKDTDGRVWELSEKLSEAWN